MSYSSTSAAATSSCVESGLDAQSTTSAPPAFSVRARFAVSVVTCRHAATRSPERRCSRSKRSRIAASTGICRSAHSMRRLPSGASARSFTSCRLVVAIQPFSQMSGGQQPLVLALLPFDPRQVVCAGEPAVDRRAKLRLPPESRGERDVGDLDAEPAAQLPQRAELVQLPQAVEAVAGVRAPRNDETRVLEVTEHPGRPTSAVRGAGDGQVVHNANLITVVSGFARSGPAVQIVEPDDVVDLRRRDLEDRRVLERLDAVHGTGAVAEAGTGTDDFRAQHSLAR